MTFGDEFFARVPVSTAVMVTATVFTSPVTYAAYKLSEHAWHRWYNRKLWRQAAWYAAAHENRVEVALVLSVGESVAESARQHLKALGKLGGAADIPVEEVFQKECFGAEEGQWFAYLEEVRKRVAKVRELGPYVYMCSLICRWRWPSWSGDADEWPGGGRPPLHQRQLHRGRPHPVRDRPRVTRFEERP